MVADRGLLSLDNIDELGKIKLPGGQALEFILAVPGRQIDPKLAEAVRFELTNVAKRCRFSSSLQKSIKSTGY